MKSSLGFGVLLSAATVTHIILAPYTKVEESFNIQAIHDLCHLGPNIKNYDHLEFPGVVPRTFIGALAVAMPACPVIKLFSFLGFTKLCGLYIARLTLASYSVAGLWYLGHTVAASLGRAVGNAFILLLCCQFHLLFYASRPLPNTLALPLVAVAIAEWMQKRASTAVCILTFTTVVVRCDLAPFLALLVLHLLFTRQIPFTSAVTIGISAATVSLLVSVGIDSLFWQRWLWPEGAVLWFNTAENRSSEWGTHSLHWYFSSALPRALLSALPLLPLGFVIEKRVRAITLISLLYVAAYSLLPHKELRFILPVFPLLNIPAAAALAWLWRRRGKSTRRALQLAAATALVSLSLVLACLFLAVSRLNYPGGEALQTLHRLPQITGVTRFGELGPPWTYSKEENIGVEDLKTRQFTFLLSSTRNIPGYELIASVLSYSHIEAKWRPKELLRCLRHVQLPFQIAQKESVFIHQLFLV